MSNLSVRILSALVLAAVSLTAMVADTRSRWAVFDLAWPYAAGWKGIYPFLMVLILIAAADTGAYFTGRKFGKVKLTPTISSGKTREGAMGGAVATTLLPLALAPHFLGTPWAVNLGLDLPATERARPLRRPVLLRAGRGILPQAGGLTRRDPRRPRAQSQTEVQVGSPSRWVQRLRPRVYDPLAELS